MSDRRCPVTYATMAILIASTTWAQNKKEEFQETYEAFAVAMGTSNPPAIPAGMSTTLRSASSAGRRTRRENSSRC